MGIPQLAVVGLLAWWGAHTAAGLVGVSLLVQVGLMARLIQRPRALAPWYNATGVTLYVLGMMVTAVALRGMAS